MKTETEARAILEPHRWTRPPSYYGAIWPEYYVVGGQHRDSGILDQSNFNVTKQRLTPWNDAEVNALDPAWTTTTASHFLVGWVETIYVLQDAPVELLAEAAEIIESLENYPILDEEDYSAREGEAAEEGIAEAYKAYQRLDVYDGTLSTGTDVKVIEQLITWFSENRSDGLSSSDDTGFYPSDEELTEALEAIA